MNLIKLLLCNFRFHLFHWTPYLFKVFQTLTLLGISFCQTGPTYAATEKYPAVQSYAMHVFENTLLGYLVKIIKLELASSFWSKLQVFCFQRYWKISFERPKKFLKSCHKKHLSKDACKDPCKSVFRVKQQHSCL